MLQSCTVFVQQSNKMRLKQQDLSFQKGIVDHNKCSHSVTDGLILVAWLLLRETLKKIYSRANVVCFAVVTGVASIICSSLVFKCLMCWSEAQHNSGISKHTQTHTQQTVSCVLRRILPHAGPSCPRPRCGLAPDVPASIISWWTNRLLACLCEDVKRIQLAVSFDSARTNTRIFPHVFEVAKWPAKQGSCHHVTHFLQFTRCNFPTRPSI